MGSMPKFLIIGAAKCGTTSLYHYLTQHPNIAPARLKEIHFFDKYDNYRKGIHWYKSQFPHLGEDGKITGEASPYYIFHPHAPYRIKKVMPNVKIIMLLRNPVDRAYSHFHHFNNDPKLTFEGALRKERIYLPQETRKIKNNPKYDSITHRRYSLLSRGRYAEQIKVWKKLFPANQMLIIKSEDFFKDEQKITNQVIEFLGLPPTKINVSKEYNVNKYPPMNSRTRKKLESYFKPYNQKLCTLLGRNLGWDK